LNANPGSQAFNDLGEERRLRELHDQGVLDQPSNAQLDRIVSLAAEILGTPIALISLVDRDRQWFLSRRGLEAQETPRDIAFCDHAIRSDRVFVVADALNDSRFQGNPLVLGDPKIRFYAGAPLITDSGQRLGTLCAIDRQPHLLTPYQEDLLAQLSAMAMHEIANLRRSRLCGLTEVLTRVALMEQGEQRFQQFRQEGRCPVLVTVVLTGLRPLNAQPAGVTTADRCLQQVAAVCRAHQGATGVLGRSGHGEFSLLWPDATEVEQHLSALKGAVEAAAQPLRTRVVITSAQPESSSFDSLLQQAAGTLS